jgi:hypothetical protein
VLFVAAQPPWLHFVQNIRDAVSYVLHRNLVDSYYFIGILYTTTSIVPLHPLLGLASAFPRALRAGLWMSERQVKKRQGMERMTDLGQPEGPEEVMAG